MVTSAILDIKVKSQFDIAIESNKFLDDVIFEPEFNFENELRPCIDSFIGNRSELEPLFKRHYDEISSHKKHNIPLAPDFNTYTDKEQNGELLFLTIRKTGKIIAYFSGIIIRPLHYNCLTLSLDLFYVVPEMRGKRNGNAGQVLLDAVRIEAKRRGIRLWTMGRKIHRGKHLEKLLENNGFEPFEVHYALWL